MFSKRKKEKLYPIIFILTILCAVGYKVFFSGRLNKTSDDVIISTSEAKESIESEETENSTIYVYICGEVNEPGVYEISRGSILYDAVIMAGGLTDDAAAEDIDLVMTLDNNISIKIPAIGEEVEPITAITSETDSGLININTADKATLMTLPGVGETTADSIISYRTSKFFETKEDLMNVPGIGEGKYDKLKNLICVD